VGVKVAEGEEPWQRLEDQPAWQKPRLNSARQLVEWGF